MYLDTYIGKNVIIDLNDAGKEDPTMKRFYNTSRDNNNLIMNKLHGTDNIGLWIDGFQTTTIYVDENLDPLPKGEEKTIEDLTYQVLIPWNYIRGLSVIENPEINERSIGFNK